MKPISDMSVEELAGLVCETLANVGITATLTGARPSGGLAALAVQSASRISLPLATISFSLNGLVRYQDSLKKPKDRKNYRVREY